MDLDSFQVAVEYVGSGKGWAGNEVSELVLLIRAHQLHINPLPQVLHRLTEDRVIHLLVEVLLEVAGGLFS